MSHIDRCEVLSDNGETADVVVYWGLPEMQRLVRMYGNAPNPMLKEYEWPGMYQPFAHQKVTASYLTLRERAFCFNEAGTGKTSSVIWAADYLMQLGIIKRVLVICPLSIMYSAWQVDIFKTAMHRSVAVAYGEANKRRKVINGEYEFVIINFDGVNIVQEDISKIGFDLIVVDEANAYKTVTTKRWKTLAKLIMPSTRLWMLTDPCLAVPYGCVWSSKNLSTHRVYPSYVTAWRDRVMDGSCQGF